MLTAGGKINSLRGARADDEPRFLLSILVSLVDLGHHHLGRDWIRQGPADAAPALAWQVRDDGLPAMPGELPAPGPLLFALRRASLAPGSRSSAIFFER